MIGTVLKVEKELAGGWRGTLCQRRGDWEFYTQIFKFPAWSGAERMCWKCEASNTLRHSGWTNAGPRAGWRRTRLTHHSDIADLIAAGLAVPALLTAVIGFRHQCVQIDVLHTVDQGVASHIIGNVMWYVACVR